MAINTERIPQSELILKAIERGVKDEAERLMKEAIQNVQEELIRRTPEIVAGITVSVMKLTEYAVQQDRVVFTIRNPENEK